MTRSSALILALASLAAACGQLLFRAGAADRVALADFLNLRIGAGLALYALGTALWIYALSKERLVVVYAFSALTFALVYLGGAVLLREPLGARGIAGVLVVLAGLYLIAT